MGGAGGAPGTPKRVFVSEATYLGKSLGNADASCKTLASTLPGGSGGGWNAYLSHDGSEAVDHIVGGGPWYLPDGGALVFPSKASITEPCYPSVAINVNNFGAVITAAPYDVWIGSSNGDCNNWDPNGSTQSAQVGTYTATGGAWEDSGQKPCDTAALRIYCFEI